MKRHIVRLVAPKTFSLRQKKGIKWVIRPYPGPHPLRACIPLALVFKNLLSYAKTTREVKKILNENEIMIDKIRRKEPKFPVGFMDVIEIPKTKEHYRVLFDKKGRLVLAKIKSNEAETKLYKVVGKKTLKKNTVQLNLYNGRNILVKKDNFKVNDTIALDLGKQKALKTHDSLIKKHLKFQKGSMAYLTGGKHISRIGVIEGETKPGFGKTIVKIKFDQEKYETNKDFVFVIDETIKTEK